MKKNDQKVIFLIRHGNTEFNTKKVFRGHYDVPLDKNGINQAEKTGKFLNCIEINSIYSSPLSRAYKTAEIIKNFQNNSNKLDILKEEGFLDLNFGDWEGKEYDVVAKLYPQIYNDWIIRPFKASIPNGEMLYAAKERCWKALTRIINEDTGTYIVIVTHRIITKLLILKILEIDESGIGIWKINQLPCCINIFEHKHQTFFVSLLNYSYHLFDIKETFFKVD